MKVRERDSVWFIWFISSFLVAAAVASVPCAYARLLSPLFARARKWVLSSFCAHCLRLQCQVPQHLLTKETFLHSAFGVCVCARARVFVCVVPITAHTAVLSPRTTHKVSATSTGGRPLPRSPVTVVVAGAGRQAGRQAHQTHQIHRRVSWTAMAASSIRGPSRWQSTQAPRVGSRFASDSPRPPRTLLRACITH